jgi:hypothetical protein
LAIERAIRATLVPIHDDEAMFERAVEIPEQGTLGGAWAAMQPQQYRRSTVGAPSQQVQPRLFHPNTLSAVYRPRFCREPRKHEALCQERRRRQRYTESRLVMSPHEDDRTCLL